MEVAELTDEFSLVDEAAAEAGRPGERPRVRRSWASVPAGGHISGVIWGGDSPELVFLHDRRESARAWDTVVLASGRPAAAIDLPGHGRSGWRRDGRYEPARIAPAVAEAIRAFAPRARLVVGTGLGGLTALAASRRYPWLVPGIALVNTLPGARADRIRPGWGAERFASLDEAFGVLAARHPERTRSALRREVRHELVRDPDGSWVWRHHPGSLPAPPDPGRSLGPDPACDELAQLPAPVTLIRSGGDGPLPEAQLARLRQRAPQIGVVTVAGAGPDLAAIHPRELAAALDGLVSGLPNGPAAGRG
jgi:pimeloyl-ACP methyl ester carboxylesterase